jgi:hypothetical protein
VSITTNVVSSNPADCEVYSILQYVIKFISDLRQGQVFSPGTVVSSTNKTDRQETTEILFKVALNTINQPDQLQNKRFSYELTDGWQVVDDIEAWTTDDGLSDKSALIKCIVLALTRPGIEPPIYQIGGANYYWPDRASNPRSTT